MILFETTEFVIEILWGVALAFFIVRLALVYFLLNFVSALALTYLVLSGRTPMAHIVTAQTQDMLLPFLLRSAVLWARVVIVMWEVPRSGAFRLGIRGCRVGVDGCGRSGGGVGWYEEGWFVSVGEEWREGRGVDGWRGMR
jgi:hypothetical protein